MHTPTCKYCGHETLLYNPTENAHICQNCERKRLLGIPLDVDLFYSLNKKHKG